MAKKRVLVLVDFYPQMSATYIESELRQLAPRYELKILTLQPANLAYRAHFAYTRLTSDEHLEAEIRAFRPDVIHGHYSIMAHALAGAARFANRPFTVRTHSFDVLGEMREGVRRFVPSLNHPLCAGVLVLPFARGILARAGVREELLHDCWPVIDFARFHDEGPNGADVMNVGACVPKHNMPSYIRLASLMPERRFNLYPMGYNVESVRAFNEQLGQPVRMLDPVEPQDMPAEYKKHQWLVYTGSLEEPGIGWPMSVAEAQAAGVGVCMHRIRPDLADYVGDGGFLFERIEDLPALLRQPFPAEMRRKAFEHARRSDIAQHIRILEDLWRAA